MRRLFCFLLGHDRREFYCATHGVLIETCPLGCYDRLWPCVRCGSPKP